MAGDFLVMDHELPDRNEVVAIHERTGVGIDAVIGRLFLFWRLADRSTTDGFLQGVGLRALASKCGGDVAFWQAVASVGWLQVSRDGVTVPRFEKRFGNSARRRMKNAQRAALARIEGRWADGRRKDSAQQVHAACTPGAPAGYPVSVSVPVSKIPVTGTGAFASFSEEDLRDTSRLVAWVASAAKRRNPLVKSNHEDRLRVIGCAERAIEHGKNPVALFVRLVSGRQWDKITNDQMDRAARRLAEIENPTPAQAPEHYAHIKPKSVK